MRSGNRGTPFARHVLNPADPRGTGMTPSRCPFPLVFALLGVLWLGTTGYAQDAPPTLTTTRIASGLAKPVWVGSPPQDDRLFVVEQSLARIRTVVHGAGVFPAYLDLSAKVLTNSGERGLLGLAFDPDFQANGWF